MKTMVVYYSQTGQSKRIAEMAAEKLHADLSEIKIARTYDEDMWKADAEAKAERNAGKLPELKGALPEITSNIVIGTLNSIHTLLHPTFQLAVRDDMT